MVIIEHVKLQMEQKKRVGVDPTKPRFHDFIVTKVSCTVYIRSTLEK